MTNIHGTWDCVRFLGIVLLVAALPFLVAGICSGSDAMNMIVAGSVLLTFGIVFADDDD